MAQAPDRASLDRLRKSGFVALIGYGLLALVAVWLIVNFVKDPTEFINVGLIGLTNGAIYGLVALGYTLVYGILQLINFAHGDVFALAGLVASTLIVSVFGLERDASVAGDPRRHRVRRSSWSWSGSRSSTRRSSSSPTGACGVRRGSRR